MLDVNPTIRDDRRGRLGAGDRPPYSETMHATYEVGLVLTRRLTVDHGRMRSSLCRMS